MSEDARRSFGVTDAMKTQPLALALCVSNVLLLAIFWFTVNLLADRAREREATLAQEQRETRELLARCVVPSPNRADTK